MVGERVRVARRVPEPDPVSSAGRWLRAAASAVGAAAATFGAATWLGTKVLTDAPRPRRFKPSLDGRFHAPDALPDWARAYGLDTGIVELRGDLATVPGRWGLSFASGYAQVGAPIDEHVDDKGETTIARPYVLLDGDAPDVHHQHERRGRDRRGRRDRRGSDRAGDRRGGDRRGRQMFGPWPTRVALAPYAWPEDPQVLAAGSNATWQIDAVPAPGGALPAWRFTPRGDVDGSTWLIGVHGRGARRAELFRLVHAALGDGVTCLVASYRTDRWTANPTSVTTLGHTEWEDVESAVRIALAHGAQRIVLAGCSLGGAITAMFLRRSRLAKVVTGVILDSPALDWPPILEHVARSNRIPRAILPGVMLAARWRSRIDWHALDHLEAADDFRHPILLVHGAEDTVVPVWLSDAFAAARPDLVTYLRVDGAGHVHAWNHASERYERSVRGALAEARTAPLARTPHELRGLIDAPFDSVLAE